VVAYGVALATHLRDVTAIAFGLTLAVLLVGGVLGAVNVRRLAVENRMVARTHEVIEELAVLLSTLKDAETGQRGYLLADDEKYLQPYLDAVGRVQGELARLQELTSDNPDQRAHLDALRRKVATRLEELHQTVALMRKGDRLAALKVVRSNTGKALMDDVRQAVAAMERAEQDRLRQRAREAEAGVLSTILSILLTTMVGIVLVGAVFYLSRKNARQRQRAADILTEQRERFRTTLASIGDAVIATDTQARVTYLNVVAESLIGWKQDEAVGQPLDAMFRIVNEQTRERVENPATRALRVGAIVGLANHTILISKDGSERPIDYSAAPLSDGEGHVVGCVLVFRDITERRQGERQRADDEARIRSVVNHVLDGIIAIDESGTVEAFNPAAEKLFGYSAEEIIGKNVRVLMPEPFHGQHDAYLANYLRTGEAKIIGIGREVEGRRKDGTTFPMDLAVSEFRLSTRRFFTGIVRDITERKRAEKEMQDLVTRLQDADRRKDEFLATLAHELRNPLAPIHNAVQVLLMKGPPDPDLKWGREVIDRQVRHMARLLDDLLDVSRISHDKLELRKERIELSAVIQMAVETSRPLIDSGGLDLTAALPVEPVVLDADPVRLAQVFSNLLNNAAKFTETGGHILLTGVREGSDVVVSVKDDGMGIAGEMLPRVFDVFSQANRVSKRSQGGLGVGLSLVRGLVELHGGSIVARSDGPGKGSEFVVRLPVVAHAFLQVAPPRDEKSQPVNVAKRRLLIVDDVKDGADALAMLLRMMGHDVHTAYDGEEAITAAAKFRPDVVLLDIGMPKLNGYDACHYIRQQPWGKEMFLIALSGWSQEADRRRAKDAGFNHHMVKPVGPDTLMKLLASLGSGGTDRPA
jgi:PAS domain S-box-containing protein